MGIWRVPVLAYHAVHPDKSIISITPEEFKWQMNWLKEEGFQVIPLRSLSQALYKGDRIEERSVVITFDDGFECIYSFALPVLIDLGFHATIFLVSDFCERDNNWPGQQAGIPLLPTLKWDQIQEMDRMGFEFGAHSSTHPRLDQLSLDEMAYEIVSSKRTLEKQLGHDIDIFAYPYGWYNDEVLAVVRENFSAGVSTRLAHATSNSDPLLIERIDINYIRGAWLFQRISDPIMPLYLSLRRPLRTLAALLFRRAWR